MMMYMFFTTKFLLIEQPPHLPFDHASTLQNSFKFWEDYELTTTKDGKKVIIKFEQTEVKI